jgi:hypothetical protein
LESLIRKDFHIHIKIPATVLCPVSIVYGIPSSLFTTARGRRSHDYVHIYDHGMRIANLDEGVFVYSVSWQLYRPALYLPALRYARNRMCYRTS